MLPMHPRDAAAYSRSKDLVRSIAVIDGQRSAFVRLGAGQPTIVFLSGAGMDIDSWFKVAPDVAAYGTVIAYDRAGVGQSDRPKLKQTADVIVATLRGLLADAGVPQPYVLVAHSLGGLFAEYFARCHPDEVAGMVLVETASPEEAADPPRPGSVTRWITSALGRIDRARGRPHGLDDVDAVAETVRQIHTAPPFPDIPLIVISGAKRMRMVPELAFRAHLEAQRSRAALSTQGRQVLAAASGHFPQLHEPAVVIEAIRDVVVSGRSTKEVVGPGLPSRD